MSENHPWNLYWVPRPRRWAVSGDYLVADLAPFRKDFNVKRRKVKIHRIKEVCPTFRENTNSPSPVGDEGHSLTEKPPTPRCPT